MEQTLDCSNENVIKKENKFLAFLRKAKDFIFKDKLNTFILLTIILVAISLVIIIYPIFYGTFMNYNTDDIAQYYVFIQGFFNRIKNGSFSLYDTSLLYGVSFFSSVYYIPLDIFSAFAFILSYGMPTVFAYLLSNILRAVFGSMLIFYVFSRKGFKNSVCLLIALIFFIGGTIQTEMVFPVYMGVLFYAPLGMLVVDLFIDKKGKYRLLLPLFGFMAILYDFYIAYMLYAFICVYFLIEMHLKQKRFFLITKEFYKEGLIFVGLIVLSLLLSAFFLLPSVFYIINETARSTQNPDKSLWLFSEGNTTKEIFWAHYFNQWINFFTPNNPYNLCLNPAGKYIREHASLYMTSGAMLYLGYFFFTWGRTENRLKLWVVLFNILFCIPLFAMIFTFNGWPYVRWFFIPFLINLYAVAYAMNTKSYNLGTKPFQKILSLLLMALGLGTILVVLITNNSMFMHYDTNDYYYYPILIGSAVFISIYIVITLLLIFLEIFKKYKGLRFLYGLLPIIIFGECIYSGSITFSNIGNEYFIYQSSAILAQRNQINNYGYNESEGYRINFYTNQGKAMSNTNILADKSNPNSFFQSFFNSNISDYFHDVYRISTSGWSKSSLYGYGILNSHITNTKYLIEQKDCQWLHLPDKYYKLLGEYTHEDPNYTNNTKLVTRYYENTAIQPFIVYDNVFEYDTSSASEIINPLKFDMILLNHGYFGVPTEKKGDEKFDEIKKDTKEKITKSGITIVPQNEIISEVYSYKTVSIYDSEKKDTTDTPGYVEFDITASKYNELFKHDAIYFVPTSSKLSEDDGSNFYFYNDNTIYNPLHYNMFYPKCYDKIEGDTYDYYRPTKFYMPEKKDATYSGKFYAFDFDYIDNYINKQNEYENKEFSLNGTKMNVKFKNNNTLTKIVKTGYAYSNDWKVLTEGYETCNIDGGFLGIIIPENTDFVDVSLEFKPDKLSTGLKVSIVGSIIYLSITIMAFAIPAIKKKRKGLN